ncbi:MAG: hypothetical protein IPK26_09345 [Planctomycetes bacterium]|nr:hypothetical protein [Planctomycetota bacterium]
MNMHSRGPWFAFACLSGILWMDRLAAQDPAPPRLANGAMEATNADGSLAEWFFNSNCGGTLVIDREQKAEGAQSAAVDVTAPKAATGQLFTNLMQSFEATAFRGQKARLRAAVRTAELASGAAAQLWLRVDGKDNSVSAFDNMGDRPIRSEAWGYFEIVLAVAADAERINAGMFVLGRGKAWLDDVSLTVVDPATPTTGGGVPAGGGRTMPPTIAKAFAEAERAPQQPFWTPWLALPGLALVCFLIGFWPSPPREPTGPEVGGGLLRRAAMRFSILYWLLYCLPGPFDGLVPVVGPWLASCWEVAERQVAEVLAGFLHIERELVPPNGSGDTTQAYLTHLARFGIAAAATLVWLLIARRRTDHAVLRDLLRSYLRYVLAFAMLGYGLAKVTMEHNQFPVNGPGQLAKTWGDSSPMNVVWAFMGASRPYTVFAGLGEVLGGCLLVWRRTATLGAIVSMGVMTNVVMINFCYDVPVKLYSSHLLVMAVLIAWSDRRLLQVLLGRAPVDGADFRGPWRNPWLHWLAWVPKAGILVFGFGLPLWQEAAAVQQRIALSASDVPAAATVDDQAPLLVRRGFRWINEVPFNR